MTSSHHGGAGPQISFADKPVLTGPRVALRPLGPEYLDVTMAALAEPESNRLTGTHATFTREQITAWLASRPAQTDRIDYAIVESDTGRYLGELSVNDLDADNRSCGVRISLIAAATDQGLGTEAMRLAIDHVFGVGIHRLELHVYDFNPRARHVYEKLGFVLEGTLRDALWWDGEWVDEHVMAIVAGR